MLLIFEFVASDNITLFAVAEPKLDVVVSTGVSYFAEPNDARLEFPIEKTPKRLAMQNIARQIKLDNAILIFFNFLFLILYISLFQIYLIHTQKFDVLC